MSVRRPGRPAKEPVDLITLDVAVARIKAFLIEKHGAESADALCYAKGTLYNKICLGQLRCWKKVKGKNLVSETEVLKLVS